MIGMRMVLAASLLLCASGLPGLFFPRRSSTGRLGATFLVSLGGVLGVFGVAFSAGAGGGALNTPWELPMGRFHVELDPLGAVFLLPIFIVAVLSSIYWLGYGKGDGHGSGGRGQAFFSGILAGAMVLVVLARDGVLFLIAWEAMALSAYFAATSDSDNPAAREAGWVYLIATHIGTLFLLAMFAFWHATTGSFALERTFAITQSAASAVFITALVGFGFKAGLMPLHVWLPPTHANAPSNVSALMSAVMLKMGIYGIARMTSLFASPPPWWGAALLALGAASGIGGIIFAIGQSDIKRLLAYSSIENIGIIAMGMGLALLGRAYGQSALILLGMGGALFHVWNHGLFKSLLFFAAGAVARQTGTRNMDVLGGLGKKMPATMCFFVIGAVAICALPPLNGFAGELLLYLGLFKALGAEGGSAAAVAAPALAMIGALAVAAFVKALGALFLGNPRSVAAEKAKESPISMLIPMGVAAGGCLILGAAPALAIPAIERATRCWAAPEGPMGDLASLAPFGWLSAGAVLLIGMALGILLLLKMLPRGKRVERRGTWDCGYAKPTARMQYTGSSFAQSIVELFKHIALPKGDRQSAAGFFPKRFRYESAVPDTVYERVVVPMSRTFTRLVLPRFRFLQQGRTQLYVLYMLVALIALLILGGIL